MGEAQVIAIATEPVSGNDESAGGVYDASGGLFSDAEFQERVKVVMNAIDPANDPDGEKFRRCLAETHTYLSLFDRGLRQMQADMSMMGGPFGLMKKMFGGKS